MWSWGSLSYYLGFKTIFGAKILEIIGGLTVKIRVSSWTYRHLWMWSIEVFSKGANVMIFKLYDYIIDHVRTIRHHSLESSCTVYEYTTVNFCSWLPTNARPNTSTKYVTLFKAKKWTVWQTKRNKYLMYP